MKVLQDLQWLMDQGGDVLWALFATCLMLWFLILERFWFVQLTFPKRLQRAVSQWHERTANRNDQHNHWLDRSGRQLTISECKLQLQSNLAMIKTLIVLCPLLGLLGTVTGMVSVFEVIAVVGTSDAQAMAQGVYRATIPTMAGLVVSLSGLYFSSRLQHQADAQVSLATDHLMNS
ncbi:MAG: MotA/TolQ/ExbB proton channel family protein [Candidatus Pelagadaptatus aseana]|uniref:MotA/TolQ/ExbB proton channel family protein n=1 Tax=Candidatus Pelagadaptatus aseana TaxID=3120508 RepID=UPI0039B13C2A